MIVIPFFALVCFSIAVIDWCLHGMLRCDTGMWILAPVSAAAGIVLIIFGNTGIWTEHLYDYAIYIQWGSITWSL